MGSGFDSIKTGLEEAIDHARGGKTRPRIYRPEPVDVVALRRRLGMTQEQFAACFGVSVATLRHWERGDRAPQGPALVLLNLIDREPQTVLRALR
ncbi:MAG: helix-turn-helix domain-containing protein [Nitrococcus sp.]|nr:helix-turn-helix domain-containing protein [Nitrococcus sp.]